MTSYPARYIVMTVVIAALLAVTINGAVVLAQEPETLFVMNPAEDETVSGVITLTGATDFLDFLKADIFLKSGDNMIWAATVHAPVINGNLARLDTRTFEDGDYQVIIRKVTSDSNYTDFEGPAFTIFNNLGAPLAHAAEEANFLYPPLSHGLARIKNCTGLDIKFDYEGLGNCSADNLELKAKAQDNPLCPYVDVTLIPCEYRGTVVGLGEERAATYGIEVEAGNVYEFDYAGNGRLFINTTKGDARIGTDTGGLPLTDPARLQPVMEPAAEEAIEAAMAPAEEGATAEPAKETPAEVVAAPTPSDSESADTQMVLPVSGQAASEINVTYIIAAAGLILLMVVGGFVAVRRGKQAS